MLVISKNKARLVKIRQDSSIYAKMSGQKFKEKTDICIVSKYCSSGIYYLQREQNTFTWRDQVNIILTM